jgi:hypothetical protein
MLALPDDRKGALPGERASEPNHGRPADERVSGEAGEGNSAHPGTRVKRWPNLFIFARNQLKSLDSEKLMKGNESFFPFISLHFLSYNLRATRA